MPREPDLYLADERGVSPQYDGTTMLREPGSKPLRKQISADASKSVVRGCRGPKSDFRGTSTFDMKNPFSPTSAEWFYIPVGTEIPQGLAETADGKKYPGKPRHYTVAPKDDMPFTLFLQHLKGLAAAIEKAEDRVMFPVSIQTLLFSLHAVSKERQVVETVSLSASWLAVIRAIRSVRGAADDCIRWCTMHGCFAAVAAICDTLGVDRCALHCRH